MRLYSIIEAILLACIRAAWKGFIMIHEILNIWHKRKLIGQVTLTPEQKKQIDEFFLENYGKRVPYWWHRLYQSYTGKFDAQYLPEYIFSVKMEPGTNTRDRVFPLEDKNMLPVLFGAGPARIPETCVMCVNGRFFDSARRIISKAEAAKILENMGDVVAKVSVDSSSGKGVRMLSVRGGADALTGESIESILGSMGGNFVIQEKLRPTPPSRRCIPIRSIRCASSLMCAAIKSTPRRSSCASVEAETAWTMPTPAASLSA